MALKIPLILATLLAVLALLSISAAHAATWQGDWKKSDGHWVGTIKFKFDDTGTKAWTEAEKKVVREAVKEWEDLADSNVDFEEVTTGQDIVLKWAAPPSGNGKTAGEMTGLNPPTGVNFNPTPTAGWYVDPDPTTDEAIPDKRWDLLSVAKHELGHVLGFKHSFGTAESLDTWGPGDRQRLTGSDAKAAKKLYPLAVGGIAELPEIAQGASARPAEGGGLWPGGLAAIAGGIVAAAVALAGGGWYARRRWLSQPDH